MKAKHILFDLAVRLIIKHKAISSAAIILYVIFFSVFEGCICSLSSFASYVSSLKAEYSNGYSLYISNIDKISLTLLFGLLISLILLYGITILINYYIEKTVKLFISCGVTEIKMFKILFFLNLIISTPGAMVGVVISILFGNNVQKNLLPNIIYLFLSVFIVDFIISFICKRRIYRKNEKGKLTFQPIKIKTNNPVILLGVNGFLANRQSFAEFIVAAEMVLVLFGIVSNYIFANTAQPDIFDIEIDSYNSEFSGENGSLVNPFYGLSEFDVKKLAYDVGTKEVVAVKSIGTVIKKIYSADDARSENNFESSDSQKLTTNFISSINGIDYKTLGAYLIDGSIDINKLDHGEEVIYCGNSDNNFSVGDVVRFSILFCDNNEQKRIDYTAKIGALIARPSIYGEPYYNVNDSFLFSNSVLISLFPELGYQFTYIKLNGEEFFNQVNDIIFRIKKNLSDKNGIFRERFWLQEAKMTTDFYNISLIAGWAINILLVVISMFFMSSFLLTKFKINKKSISILLNIGINKNQIIKFFLIENLINSIRALLLGTAASMLFGILSSLITKNDFASMIPYYNIFVFAIITLFVTIMVTVLLCEIEINQ